MRILQKAKIVTRQQSIILTCYSVAVQLSIVIPVLLSNSTGLSYMYDQSFVSYNTGPGCSKLTTLLVNVSLKFQMLISQIHQYFLLKKCEMLLHCKSFSHFFNKKFKCIGL